MRDPFEPPHEINMPPTYIVVDKPHDPADTGGGLVNTSPVQAPDNSPIDGGSPTTPPDINIPESIPEENKISTPESRATLSAPSNEEQNKVFPKQADVSPSAENRTNAVTLEKETPGESLDLASVRKDIQDAERRTRDLVDEFILARLKKYDKALGSKKDQAKRVQEDKPESEVKIGDSLLYPYIGFPPSRLFEPEVFLPKDDIPDVMKKDEWLSQQPDDKACYRTCKKMVMNHGVTPKHFDPSTDFSRRVTIWTEEEEGKSLSPVQDAGNDNYGSSPSEYLMGLIDTELEQGNPIIVGVNVVSHKDPSSRLKKIDNANRATHHFVVIVGRSYDSKTGEISYHYFDPAPDPTNRKYGTSENNRLYVTPNFIIGGNQGSSKTYIVTEVRANQ